jgi:hypothetical protein
MRKIKSKNLLIKQGSVYGVKNQSKMIDDGVRLSAVTSLKNTQNNKPKRRKIVKYANLQGLEPWQIKIFAKNAKKGWRFFQPDSIDTPTPRSAREAWGGTYKHDDFEKKENRSQKIMTCIFIATLLLLSIL